MYPAQALFDGLYTIDDLPDVVFSVSSDSPPVIQFFYKLSSPQPSIDSLGTSYYRGIDQIGSVVGIGLTDGDVWTGTEVGNEGGFGSPCLLDDPIEFSALKDQFADSYTITYNSDITCESVSSTVTRESLCVWRGIADDGSTITLEIEFGSFSNLYAWTTNAPNCGGNKRGIGMPFDRYNNLGRLNTPLGNYEDEITPGSIIHTVS